MAVLDETHHTKDVVPWQGVANIVSGIARHDADGLLRTYIFAYDITAVATLSKGSSAHYLITAPDRKDRG